ncbi:MAG: hypothetical protein CSA95_00330 [Bacteroidetes bacterium]|nr:MAG: hypothetical protein CSA95_00330 [Bacteroidota bacterium]
MKSRRFIPIATLLLIVGLGSLHAQSIYVNESDGTETGYALKRIQRMDFTSGSLTITKSDGHTDPYELNSLRHLTFTSETVNTNEVMASVETSISLYPNPVTHTLHLNLENAERGTICIFDLDGRLLHTQQTDGKPSLTLRVDQLRQGVYLCRYGNSKETKTIKFIKK